MVDPIVEQEVNEQKMGNHPPFGIGTGEIGNKERVGGQLMGPIKQATLAPSTLPSEQRHGIGRKHRA